MRSVRPEEIQDIYNWPEARTFWRWRSPKVISNGYCECFFFLFSFFSLLATIRSRMSRVIWPATKFIGPRFTATKCLASSRECSTIVAARNCATPAIVFCVRALLLSGRHIILSTLSHAQLRAHTKVRTDHILHWLLRFLSLFFFLIFHLFPSFLRLNTF